MGIKLNISSPHLQIIDVLADQMGEFFPEIKIKVLASKATKEEEQNF